MTHNQRITGRLRINAKWWFALISVLLLVPSFFVNLIAVDSPFPVVQIGGEPFRLFRDHYTLCDMFWAVFQRNAFIGLFCAAFFFVFPLVRCVTQLAPQFACKYSRIQTVIRVASHWDLLPLLAVALLLLSLLAPSDAPAFHLRAAFYSISLREIVIFVITVHEWRTKYTDEEPKGRHKVAALVLSALAFVSLIAGLFGPAFHVQSVGILTTPSKSLFSGIVLLFEQRHIALAIVLLVFSVVFPLSKVVALVWALCRQERISKGYLKCLEVVGPLSFLDAVAIVVLMVGYSGIPVVNATVVVQWGYWAFVVSVLLNSMAVSLSSTSPPPIHTP
jgi:hypothetical protein